MLYLIHEITTVDEFHYKVQSVLKNSKIVTENPKIFTLCTVSMQDVIIIYTRVCSLKFVITGSFNIGVSLHACGVATDLVIQKCIENKASFVSCPCCYGSVQENHMVSYPRSQIFKEVPIAFKVSFSGDYTSELLDEAFRGGQKKTKIEKKSF